ncbi:MAG: HD domain-containing protein [Nitrospinaceae bacterium]
MRDFYLANRTLAEQYRFVLQQKIAADFSSEIQVNSGKPDPQKFYLEFKNRVLPLVQKESEKLQAEILRSDNAHLLLLKRTALVDTIVHAAFQTAIWFYNHLHQCDVKDNVVPVAIVARGGYGREEMYFRSDVDLQIVSKCTDEQGNAGLCREIIQHFEYLFVFQDLFPAAGSSCFSETTGGEQEFHTDKVPDFFSLLEHRFIAGNPLIYTEFKSSIKTASLIHKEKILKYCFKHRTYYEVQNTVFKQEPNVKEELRRLYWALTLVRIRQNLEKLNQFEMLNELFSHNLLSAPAFKNMQNALNFLSRVRMLLHLTQRGAHRDVLSYEVRDEIAQAMGYDLKTFYKEYFYHAGYPLKRYSRNLFWESMAFDTKKVAEISDYFALNAENQIVFNKDPKKLFSDSPQWIFQVFVWVAEKNYHLSYPVIRSIEDHVDQTVPIFLDRQTKAGVLNGFKKIIEGKYFSKALRLLHEFGLLGDYFIPEFKNICGLLQDIYVHKFPTDMHILSSLDALNLLETGKEADPFLIDLYQSLKDKTALKLAVLLHDIGKGAKVKDQNEELVGARLVPRILGNLGYTDNSRQVEDVAFLVEKHLTIYDLMLLDPEEDETYEMVLDLVGHDKERLKMLVLLTYADRAGTKMKMSPSQIEQLKLFYQYTLYHKKHEEVPNTVKLEFLQMVRLPRDLRSQLETYYEFSQSSDEFAVEFLFKPGQAADLIVCGKDQKKFLFNIATVLAFNHLNIVEANIHTLGDNVFDVFKVVTSTGEPIDHSNFFFFQKQVTDDLRRTFVKNEPVSSLFKGRDLMTRQEKMPYKDVKLKTKIIGRSVTLSTHDLIGTFMMETRVFSQFNMEIQRAVLHTHQGTASNIFYLRPEDVKQIIQNEDHFQQKLRKALRLLIDSKPCLIEQTTEVA